MIRYFVSEAELLDRIRTTSPSWLERAGERTERFRAHGRYDEASSMWSEVKVVYMEIQHDKCAYCERRLEGPPYGSVEHDLEHFRPKSSVEPWPPAAVAASRGLAYDFALGEAADPGYFLLAYHPLNYATACKSCNTPLKSNYFPVAGRRICDGDDPRALAGERPFLIYPIGDLDDDPEALLHFQGVLCVPRHLDGHLHWRARVTIDFFDLNERETLWRQRAEVVRELFLAFLVLDGASSAEARAFATATVDQRVDPSSAHCGCARAFVALIRADPVRARACAVEAIDWLSRLPPRRRTR